MNTKLLFTTACCYCLLVVCVFTSCSIVPDTPPYAASTKTWKIGDQVWSDAIQVPECHKTSFPLYEMEDWARQPLGGPISDLSTIPCRAYTDGQNTWYYYSLHFVIAAQPFLCPHPWRVPGLQDIKLLANNDKDLNMSPEWARGEYCCPNVRADEILNEGRYWSSWMHPSTDNEGAAVRCKWTKYWTVVKGEYEVQCHVWDDEYAQCGLQVRCVRD